MIKYSPSIASLSNLSNGAVQLHHNNQSPSPTHASKNHLGPTSNSKGVGGALLSRMSQSPYKVAEPRKIPMEKLSMMAADSKIINLRDSLPLPPQQSPDHNSNNYRIAMEIAKARSRSEMGMFAGSSSSQAKAVENDHQHLIPHSSLQ